jgi:predicted transcriptional regulator
MRRTTIFMPEDLDRRLQAASRRTHRARSELIREALVLYLQQLQPSGPRSLGMGASQDEEVSSENVKQWVHGEWARRADAG